MDIFAEKEIKQDKKAEWRKKSSFFQRQTYFSCKVVSESL